MLIFVSDLFVNQYTGGAELTSEALISGSYYPVIKVNSNSVTPELMEKYKDSYWIFGNFSNVPQHSILFAIKNLNYSVIEYDYKFCVYRSIEKHNAIDACNCAQELVGKIVSLFFNSAKHVWFMSEAQKQKYIDKFPFLDKQSTRVLSSVFSKDTLGYIRNIDCENKNNKWIILDSPSWVKGANQAEQHAISNNLEYEKVFNLEYHDFLKKLASSKGVIYLPLGSDTCPRLVIEAKMLGCQLILNDKVQHESEPWFDSQKSVFDYLSSRSDIFWAETEKVWNLDTPKPKATKENKINIIVPLYNVSEWVGKLIDSVKRQNYKNFQCLLINDLSTDDSINIIESKIQDDNRFALIDNKEKKYALGNIVDAISNIQEPDSIYILLDGDDWIPSTEALSHLNNIYSENNCLVTFGSYVYSPAGNRGVEPSAYPEKVVKNNTYREDTWRASHMRSFKGKIWDKINSNCLKDENGNYYLTAYDQAIMLPLLEMAAERAFFIKETMYVYNRQNPNNVDKIKQKIQFETAQEIRRRTKYTRIDDEDFSRKC
jgi:hypothetical protein|tara:strand:+ start:118 stop:1749 length:1632 start_codon:yes stop_codon:yes gene_type:complete